MAARLDTHANSASEDRRVIYSGNDSGFSEGSQSGDRRGNKPGAGFNGRVNGFTCIDSARPVADQ